MERAGATTFLQYKAVLEADPEEFFELFNTILINVTAFMRDRDAWDYIATDVIPRIVDRKDDGEAIRVWSAGCASGEEAYSLAVLLCEAVGEERFRAGIKIYGTDVDEDALARSRHARYP